MSKRDWFGDSAPYLITFVGLFFVLAVSWTVFYSEGHQSARESYEAEKAKYAAAYKLQSQCFSLGTTGEVKECLSRHEAPSREEKRAEEDLNAQREMADWAKGMLWASWFGVLITGLGTVFVALTLRATRDTISLMRQEFVSAHRPRLVLKRFHLNVDQLVPGKEIVASFVAQNIGDTKARVIEVRSAAVILPKGEPIPEGWAFPFREKLDFILSPGGSEVFPANGGIILDGGQFSAIFAGKQSLHFLGVVIYSDDNGSTRETGYCRRYDVASGSFVTVKSEEYEYAY